MTILPQKLIHEAVLNKTFVTELLVLSAEGLKNFPADSYDAGVVLGMQTARAAIAAELKDTVSLSVSPTAVSSPAPALPKKKKEAEVPPLPSFVSADPAGAAALAAAPPTAAKTGGYAFWVGTVRVFKVEGKPGKEELAALDPKLLLGKTESTAPVWQVMPSGFVMDMDLVPGDDLATMRSWAARMMKNNTGLDISPACFLLASDTMYVGNEEPKGRLDDLAVVLDGDLADKVNLGDQYTTGKWLPKRKLRKALQDGFFDGTPIKEVQGYSIEQRTHEALRRWRLYGTPLAGPPVAPVGGGAGAGSRSSW